MAEWHYAIDGKQYGPVTSQDLKQLAAVGQLSSSDLVWREGTKEWITASKIKGLFHEKKTDSPPPIPLTANDIESSTKTIKVDSIKSIGIDWNSWDIGGKTIIVSACVAIISMVMKWVDVGVASANGFSQGAFLFLGVFVYPVMKVFSKKAVHRSGGVACGVIGLVLAYGYISSRNVALFGQEIFAAANGPYIFLLASIGLIVGTVKYKSPDERIEL